MASVKLKLSPPWVTYVNMLMRMFEKDPDIKIEYINDECTVKMYVDNDQKAVLLTKFLPCYKDFGNVDLGIEIIPANDKVDYSFGDNLSEKDVFDALFKDNPVYKFSYEVDTLFSNKILYVVFEKEVVQFFNDNLHDVYGNVSTLYQNIAEELFEDCEYDLVNVFYCTDATPGVGAPLGEWP